MFGIKEANEYMTKMRSAVGRHLNDPDSITMEKMVIYGLQGNADMP